jgi:hypothetical protein
MVNEELSSPALRAPRTGWLAPLAALLLGWVLLHPRGIAVVVDDKPWRREIDIERQVMEMFSEPCDRVPVVDAQLQARRTVDGVAHCRFLGPAWRKGRMAVADGGADDAPRWPYVQLQAGERLGPRREQQELRLRDEDDGRHWNCRLDAATWRAWPLGAKTRLAVHRFSGVADCASLPPPPR